MRAPPLYSLPILKRKQKKTMNKKMECSKTISGKHVWSHNFCSYDPKWYMARFDHEIQSWSHNIGKNCNSVRACIACGIIDDTEQRGTKEQESINFPKESDWEG